MTSLPTLVHLEKTNDPVFLRADLNVPLKNGKIIDVTRIVRLIPTIQNLLQKTDKIIIATHLGRPESTKIFTKDDSFSTAVLVPELEKHFKDSVYFLNTCVDYEQYLKKPGIYVLQNLRFYEGEESNDDCFAKALIGPCQVYVNDAFSCSHRAHASVSAIAKYAKKYAGLLMEDELNHLLPIVNSPQRPFMAIVGGSKVSTKIKLLESLLTKVDCLVIGGAMANTFLKAQGIDIGKSLYEEDYLAYCREILEKTEKNKIILPVDFKVGTFLQDDNPVTLDIGDDIKDMILDFGPKSVDLIKKRMASFSLVVWNGPVGAYEYIPYDESSAHIAKIIADLTKEKTIISIAGGGDTLALLQKTSEIDHFSYTSTAGGAFLELLEGRALPGVEALQCV